jgi:hypothetical protein
LFRTQMAEAPPAAVVMASVCELFLNNCKLTWLRDSPSLPHLRYLSLADNRYTASARSSHVTLPHLPLKLGYLTRRQHRARAASIRLPCPPASRPLLQLPGAP